jgi:hypothetical protein
MVFDGTFTADSLFLLKDGTYTLQADITVNKRLQTGGGGACGGLMEITSSSETVSRTINAGSADVDVSNALITRVNISGSNPPYDAVNSSDGDPAHPSTGWNFMMLAGTGTTWYWIGGTGNWSDPAHWSQTSGVSSGNTTCIPSPLDNVVFDAGSELSGSKTVTVDVGAVCNNMSWTGPADDKPRFQLSANVNIYGSLILQAGMTVPNSSLGFIFKGTGNHTITSNGVTLGCPVTFNATGSWKLLDDFKSNYVLSLTVYAIIHLQQGHLDFNGQTVSTNQIRIAATATNANSSLNMANSNITITTTSDNSYYSDAFQNLSSSFTVSAASTANSTVTITGHFKPQPNDVFNKVISTYRSATIDPATFKTLSFTNGVGNLGAIVADTLIFKGGAYPYLLRNGSSITVNKRFIPGGTPCVLTEIWPVNTTAGSATLRVGIDGATVGDTCLINFVRIYNVAAQSDGVNWSYLELGENAPRQGNFSTGLTDWTLAPYVGTEVSTGLGRDRQVCDPNMPLTSARFAPTPDAAFEWQKKPASGGTFSTVSTSPDYLADESGEYVLKVTYDGAGGTCYLQDTIKLTFEYRKLYWTGAADADWNNPDNWSETAGGTAVTFIPTECTDVHIPAGMTTYPDLTPGATTYTDVATSDPIPAACLNIYFEHGGEALRTDSLHYTGAYMDLTLASNRWYLFSPPLRNFYPGDIYVSNPNPVQDGYFVETMLFNANNPQTGEYHSYTWSGRFNNPDVALQAGEGMAVWIDRHGTGYTDHPLATFSFPKSDPFYYYYNYGGNPYAQTPNLERTYSGRFIYESVIDASNNVSLTGSPCSATESPVLVGNPFPAHLDMNQFLTDNADIYDGYKLASGVNIGADGKMNDMVSYKKIGGAWYTTSPTDEDITPATQMIAPMQSFIVISKVTNPVIKANAENHTALSPGNTLRSATLPQPGKALGITATRDNHKSRALLLQFPNSTDAYSPEEDSYRLFPESTLASLSVYTRSSDGYALDINSVQDLNRSVPLCLRTSEKGQITLSFSNAENFAATSPLYLHDLKLNRCIDLHQQSEYIFDKDDNSLYLEDRFVLSSVASPTGINQTDAGRIIIQQTADGAIHILSNTEASLRDLSITDVQGRILAKETNAAIPYIYKVATPGVYIVRVSGEQGTVTKKIIIK